MPNDIQLIRSELEALADPKYRVFSASLIPNAGPILGVRISVLRPLAKKIAAQGGAEAFLTLRTAESMEETMLRGLLIAGLKKPFDEQLSFVRAFIPQIDNWAVCDTFAMSLKSLRKQPQAFWDFLRPYFDSPAVYDIRFAVVSYLAHYSKDPEKTDWFFNRIPLIKSDDYYVNMAVAWALAEGLVHSFETTHAFLKRGKVSADIKKKAIQKGIDSLRLTARQKDGLRRLRKL